MQPRPPKAGTGESKIRPERQGLTRRPGARFNGAGQAGLKIMRKKMAMTAMNAGHPRPNQTFM